MFIKNVSTIIDAETFTSAAAINETVAIPKALKTRFQVVAVGESGVAATGSIKIFGSLDGTKYFDTELEEIELAISESEKIYTASLDTQDVNYLKVNCTTADAAGYEITVKMTTVTI
jgi:hypothetical protein